MLSKTANVTTYVLTGAAVVELSFTAKLDVAFAFVMVSVFFSCVVSSSVGTITGVVEVEGVVV